VHALDVRRPDEDFAIGFGQGQVLKLTRGDLDGDVGLGLAVGVRLEEVGAFDGADQQGDPTQRPVVVQALDVLKQGDDALVQFGDRRLAILNRTAFIAELGGEY